MGRDGTELLDEADAPAADETAGASADARATRRDKLVFRAALVIAAFPFVVTAAAMILTVGGDYHPAGDLAMTEMHTGTSAITRCSSASTPARTGLSTASTRS